MQNQNSIFSSKSPKVFTIEPYQNFLKSLAVVLADELLCNDEFISDAIIILPTRRAARQLAQEFLESRPNLSTILPRIRTLGDIDPEDVNLSGIGGFLDFAPNITSLQKQFELAKLIALRDEAAGWSNDPQNALKGASALIDLLDSAELMAEGENGLDWSKLDNLVEVELAEHWQKSREFLKIITEYWPKRLNELGLCDPANRRRLAIETLAKSWESAPPKFPVIIAGSTGSIPAARNLMRVVSRLEKGCVVLPGLDLDMEENSWKTLWQEDGHPQRILHDTINKIGIRREDVKYWPSNALISDAARARRKILNLALMPKEATADWLKKTKELGTDTAYCALNGLSLIEAESEDEEASAIALHMRETLEHKGKTCALISPNQNIGQRVAEKMQKWGIKLDISSGKPFFKSENGLFIDLVSEFLLDSILPKNIMALLNHPFAKFGMNGFDKKIGANGLEIALLRGASRDRDLTDLAKRADNFSQSDWNYARANQSKTKAVIRELLRIKLEIDALKPSELNIANVAEFLAKSCEIIAKDENKNCNHLWTKEAGKIAANLFSQLIEDGKEFPIRDIKDGINIIKGIMAQNVVRPVGNHPHLAILGPLEARLLHFDKYILAGLDDGIWPQPSSADPFLSRPMRSKLGLQSRELRMGLASHDFAQLAANENVILTRSARRGGAPSVPSRWVWRLKTLIAGAIGEEAANYALSNREFDALAINKANAPKFDFEVAKTIPRPKPNREFRPTMFSATQIESLIRDPYKIYVNKVLDLRPLDELGGEISAKERGSAIHKALEIVKGWEKEVPTNAIEFLLNEFKIQLLNFGYAEDEIALEVERLLPSAQLMVEWQKARAQQNFKINIEKRVEAQLETKGVLFTIKATADRIDIDPSGYAEIWDYKTGTPPTDRQISSLFAAQLPVTSWILRHENTLNIKNVSAFGHIHIGNKHPEIKPYEGKQDDKKPPLSMDEVFEKTDQTLRSLLTRFHNDDQIYASKPRVDFLYKSQTYEDKIDRLARRQEWADATDGESDE